MNGSMSCGETSRVPHVALWTQVIRRRAAIYQPPEKPRRAGFDRAIRRRPLHAKYRDRLANETLMVNEVYLAVVHQPDVGRGHRVWHRRCWRGRSAMGRGWRIADALDACEKLAQTLSASLARYEPELLGYLSIREYLVLVAARVSRTAGQRRVAARAAADRPLNQALATTRLLFGTEAIEYRSPTATRVGAMLGIKEYPTPSVVGMYNRLLVGALRLRR